MKTDNPLLRRSFQSEQAAATPSFRGIWLLVAIAISLVLSMFKEGAYVLYPFKLLTTWVHECGHALMAVLVGGSVESVTIAPDTSGLTQSLIPRSTLSRALVSSAGYLGASVFGCLLLAATRVERASRAIVLVLGGMMLMSLIFWIRNLFGALTVLGLGCLLVVFGAFVRGKWASFMLTWLAVQIALNAIFDIRVLFLLDDSVHSDARTMSKILLLPSWFWASLWMLLSLALMGFTLWLTRHKDKPALLGKFNSSTSSRVSSRSLL